jgi:ATP synthase protein I
VSRPRPTDELESLEARLAEAKARHAPVDPVRMAGGAMGQGFRFALEIVITTVVGSAIGWQLDRWLGTKPWLLLLFMLLGLAAGFMSLFRAVSAEQRLVDALPVPPAAPLEPED